MVSLFNRSFSMSDTYVSLGNWVGIVPLPKRRTLQSRATSLDKGENRDKFLDLIQGLLCWLPEERLNPHEAFIHPWVQGSD